MSAPEKMTAVTDCNDQSRATEFSLVARRNNSLSSTGRLLVFAFIFVVSVGIAAAFAYFGAWLILPFAGLEMLVLYLAFRYIERHAADCELIEIDGDRLALRSHGREFEIGRTLSDAQRLELAQALRHRLRDAG